MRVEAYEKTFLALGGTLLVVCLLALLYATVAMGLHLPKSVGKIDPATVDTTPPFDQPGVRQTGPGRYEVVLIAQAWRFIPNEIRVPAGAEVTIRATSPDVIHGLDVVGTRINMMIIPGQVATATYRFGEPGEHLFVCHEFCGINHHTMFGKVIVE